MALNEWIIFRPLIRLTAPQSLARKLALALIRNRIYVAILDSVLLSLIEKPGNRAILSCAVPENFH